MMNLPTKADLALFYAMRDYYSYPSPQAQQAAIEAAISDGASIDNPDILRAACNSPTQGNKLLIKLLEHGADPQVTIPDGHYKGMSLLGMECLTRDHEARDILFTAGARLTEFDKAFLRNPDHVPDQEWSDHAIEIDDALRGIENSYCPSRYKLPSPKLLKSYYGIDFDLEKHQRNLAERNAKKVSSLDSSTAQGACIPVAYEGIVDARAVLER